MRPRPLRVNARRGTRLARHDTHEFRLEAVAAEFALNAQRRARLTRQIELLERQRAGAMSSLAQVEARMVVLQRRMRGAEEAPAAVAPAPPQRPRIILEY
ncbi:hypothetical protein [Roseococcus thiosulfatophilus]|uniref:hypothetical protein n=1 Tax=Roseococcus thiosulfatophilus TaxID=35813 RepID=UPI001A8F31B3|nr:hypothetical protein [Roseococcus thiosulfatophilus]